MAGADVTADAACPGALVIVDRYAAHKELAVHGNPDAVPGARIAAFGRLRPVLCEDRLTVCPAWFQRMALAEFGRFSVASMVSRRAGHALAELMWSLCRKRRVAAIRPGPDNLTYRLLRPKLIIPTKPALN